MRNKALLTLLLVQAVAAQERPFISQGKAHGQVCVRSPAGPWERQAAEDLCSTLEKMTGVRPPLQNAPGAGFNLVVGELALQLRPELRRRLAPKKQPVLRCDAIVLQRSADALYLAGSNDDSHYFAVAELLRRWGCRWYLPAPWGEHIPHYETLTLGQLDYSYSPPFEVRQIWISWNGNREGFDEFAHRNFLNQQAVPSSHALSVYADKIPGFSLVSPESARQVAEQTESMFAQSQSFSLSMEDGVLLAKAPADKTWAANLQDKFFHSPIVTDNYMVFLNQVCGQLQHRHPQSTAKIGFLAYTNLTLPPQRDGKAADPLVAYLAPIDMDPNHPFDDDMLGILKGWLAYMSGRVILYDYDQGMLVWRDLPNPSHQVVASNVKTARQLGLLGFGTESRNAAATTFLNLYFRAQLYWNPELQVDGELNAFYDNFYGAASAPMKRYWQAIYQAWRDTLVTEHEYFVVPAVYPRSLVTKLGAFLRPAVELEEPYRSRLKMAQLGYAVLDNYTKMVECAASQCEYAAAACWGRKGLEARRQLTAMHDSFTTYARMPEEGPAFWPGEVKQYEQLARLPQVEKTPLYWSLRLDPEDHGLWQGWAQDRSRAEWNLARTDLYLQAQTTARPGYAWYRCQVRLPTGRQHLVFPGLFNESWLYWDGKLHAHRPQESLWWHNPYDFSWDVDLGEVTPGMHWITLRNRVDLHMAGLFRRPFFYLNVGATEE